VQDLFLPSHEANIVAIDRSSQWNNL
jgi:hypothetical protein